MLTLHYRTPLSGARRGGSNWTIERVAFPPLEQDAPKPDEALVKVCHDAMRDDDGKKVPIETLRTYDLRGGLAAAFRAIDTMPAAKVPVSQQETAR
jgi:hypothetical protein